MIRYINILETGKDIQERVRLWRNTPRIKWSMTGGEDITPEQHSKWLDSLAGSISNKVQVAFAGTEPFGIINLKKIDCSAGTSDWGIYIGEEAFLGRGIGKRLVYDVHTWGFSIPDIQKMYSVVRADNPKALCSYLKMGITLEGCLRKQLTDSKGKPVDLYPIALFRENWEIYKKQHIAWGKIGDGVICHDKGDIEN